MSEEVYREVLRHHGGVESAADPADRLSSFTKVSSASNAPVGIDLQSELINSPPPFDVLSLSVLASS